MSCFICSDLHVNALAHFAVSHKLSWRRWDGELFYPECDRQGTVNLLFKANVNAYVQRYPDVDAGRIAPTTYEPPLVSISPVALLKACDAYEYQADQWSEYEGSGAQKQIAAIRLTLIKQLDGYGSAPWDLGNSPISELNDRARQKKLQLAIDKKAAERRQPQKESA